MLFKNKKGISASDIFKDENFFVTEKLRIEKENEVLLDHLSEEDYFSKSL